MGLVDYSSSDSEPSPSPPAKRRKPSQPPPPSTTLPPLPPTFHDLYAHTVRHSPVDDPSLHQGRQRVIPHVAGNWPSHIYIEWITSAQQHALLSSFLDDLQAAVPDTKLSGFLTSDLGAPLPLHVSLSRPFVLSTAEKDEFQQRLAERVGRTGVGKFKLGCSGGVEWHRAPESGRSFLVLRVRSRRVSDFPPRRDEHAEAEEGAASNHNPELTTLLTICNTTVESYGQPKLYEWADDSKTGDAFHVSIAWSFAEPDEELRARTAEVFAQPEFMDAIREIEFDVDGVKAKIGNVVHHIPLARDSKRSRGLFGI